MDDRPTCSHDDLLPGFPFPLPSSPSFLPPCLSSPAQSLHNFSPSPPARSFATAAPPFPPALRHHPVSSRPPALGGQSLSAPRVCTFRSVGARRSEHDRGPRRAGEAGGTGRGGAAAAAGRAKGGRRESRGNGGGKGGRRGIGYQMGYLNQLRAKVDSNGSKIHTERNVVVPVSFFVTYPAPKQQTLHYGYYSPLPPPSPVLFPLTRE